MGRLALRSRMVALGVVGASAACAPGGGGGGGVSDIEVSGRVTSASGGPVAGAKVTAVGASTTSEADGSYLLAVDLGADAGVGRSKSRLVVRTTAPGQAPMLSVVSLKPGVVRYQMPISLQSFQEATVSASEGGDVTVNANGQSMRVSLPPGSVSGTAGNVTIRVASYDYRNGPGRLESRQGNGDLIGLQSAGMFYIEVVDAEGNPVQLAPGAGLRINSEPFTLPPVPESQPMSGWTLNDDGQWENPTPTTEPEEGMALDTVPPQVYYNCDRGYPTACIRGTLRSGGRACPGQLVRAEGPPGIASSDSAGAAGDFCFTGPLGAPMTISAGASSGGSVTMGNSYGGCAEPASCTTITDFQVPEEDCPEQPDAGAADARSPDTGACEYSCASGGCIAASVVCNGAPDCPGGEDEEAAMCNNEDSCCIATKGCPGETGSDCAETCCCCPGGEACCADPTQGCCASP